MSEFDSKTEAFFAEMSKLLRDEQLIPSDKTQEKYGKTTFDPLSRIILGAVLPHTKEEVISVINCARTFGVHLYPISTGKNWGYGSAVPVQENCLIVDLSIMNRIEFSDEKLGLVTLQPGVTFRQLSEYIERQGMPFLCPVTGGGPGTSLVGNALERGISSSQYYDRYYSILGIEAVLADGTVYSSLSQGGGELQQNFYKWGMGPYLDGIFGQSNFGIVTSVTFALAPKTKKSIAFIIEKKSTDDLANVIEKTRSFLFDTKNIPLIRILNYERFSPIEDIEKKASNKMNWLVIGVVGGNEEMVRGMKKIARFWYADKGQNVVFFSMKLVRFLKSLIKILPYAQRFFHNLQIIENSLNISTGKILPKTPKIYMPGVVGTKKWVNIDNPRAGLTFFYAVAPMNGSIVVNFLNQVENVCRTYNFSPPIALHNISERCLLISLRLVFDRQDLVRVDDAKKCYNELLVLSTENGIFPSRLNIDSMSTHIDGTKPFWKLVSRIKEKLDPQNIISPGRYVPRK